jgi:hypothetical protein
LGFDTFSIRFLFRRSQYPPTIPTGLLLLDNDPASTDVHRLELWLVSPRYGRDRPIFIRFVEGVSTGVRRDQIPRITICIRADGTARIRIKEHSFRMWDHSRDASMHIPLSLGHITSIPGAHVPVAARSCSARLFRMPSKMYPVQGTNRACERERRACCNLQL